MGILDGLLSSVLGGAGTQGTPAQGQLVQVALQLIQQNGGLPGIISKFQQGGMGQQVGSWVGSGANLPINGSQLQEVLGSGAIGQIATQLGLSHADASSNLAQVLPQLIDRLTPTGQLSADHADLLAKAASQLSPKA